jgi:PAS domain S-box-containing protein
MSPSAIFIYQDGPLLFANPGAETLTGYAERELLQMRVEDLLHPDDRGTLLVRDRARGAESSGSPARAEFRILTKQGLPRWVDYRWGWIRFQGEPATLGTAFDISERKRAEEELRLLTTELTLTEERERRRMATFLHDVIGQTLALCRIKIRGLEKASPPEAVVAPLGEVRELVDLSIRNTRSLTFELCPPILYELSFEAAVGWLGEEFHRQHGIVFDVRNDPQPKPLSEEMRIILFQAVREIFVNVIKHASARTVSVTIARDAATIRVTVRDDGAGFDPTTLARAGSPGGGFGLFNVRERLKYLGGVIDVTSAPGTGAVVTIAAPLKPGGDEPPERRPA